MATFTYHVERYIAVWERDTRTVEADTQEEADAIIIAEAKEDEFEQSKLTNCAQISGTSHPLPIEMNDNEPTLEVYRVTTVGPLEIYNNIEE